MLLSLIENLDRLDVILASASPRRYELLKNAGLNFSVQASGAEEDSSLDLPAHELAMSHAKMKGLMVAKENPLALVVSADTVVVCEEELMGKPLDDEDAMRMLSKLSGKTHKVITAFGLTYQKYEDSVFQTEETDVTFRSLSEEEILAYISTSEPFDKAGAYGIQGQGALLIKEIKGCFYNVMGFPLSRFYCMLDKYFGTFVF